MLKRTINIASRSLLSTKDGQLVVRRDCDDSIITVPVEDIGLLEIDSLQVTTTTALLVKLLENGSTTIFCDSNKEK